VRTKLDIYVFTTVAYEAQGGLLCMSLLDTQLICPANETGNAFFLQFLNFQ